jgi:hypothetical protein
MIERSFDPERANYLINHPAVRPFVGGDGKSFLDLTPVVSDDKNYLLLGDHGGFLATWSAPGAYEIHTFILPEGRGRAARELALEARAYLASIGADHLWTRVQKGMENVRLFTLAAGFEPCGKQVCDFGGGPTDYELFNWRA